MVNKGHLIDEIKEARKRGVPRKDLLRIIGLFKAGIITCAAAYYSVANAQEYHTMETYLNETEHYK